MGKPITHPEGNPDTADTLAAWYELIVWNDDVNTFDWVIESLMEICHHTLEQATQCAYIIHFKGKYAVRKGSYELLHPMKDALTDRGIQATLSACGEEI
ncbi:MAG: ATP-dependent Clp protease adaptor ClpS [Thermoflavifilum aggregans]|nr:ATP-dependent Clp protease adaptor ClpS [Thermoflavifilum aggregans]